ncbi:MAG: hypothetical protein IJS86_08305, partial [Lachnospiraceae bacterium]|nr:hypothetical protein [Lachnospiraceae bacterium]
MASFWKRKFHERMLVLLLCLVLAVQSTGCANVVNHLGKGYDREDSSKDGEDVPSDIPDFDPDEKEDTKHREKKDIDYSTDRFNIEGTNAFYILPGLENIPDAMAVFEVLDYNRLGEFVYYYVTPCYVTPEEFSSFVNANKTGTVDSRTGVTVPEGRREDYEYDAGVLMSYNPDNGQYRIMYADTFEIDKEKEFDPATEGRPYMYRSRDMNEDSKSRVYMAERLMGCKVAGREEYLLMDQSSLTGVVYDSRGNAERTMTYRPALASEMENRKEEFKKKKDHGNKKIMNAALTGLVMTRAYESYLGITFFMGDYDNEDDIDEDDLQVSMTMMIYREPLNRKDGGTPFVSVNLNADRQKEKWLSLDGKFFTDRSEYEKAEGYSFEDLKNGKYGNEYRDAFSPFSLSDPEEEAS